MQTLDRRRTVWVVDDSATDAQRVCRVLEPEYDVEVFHDSAVALERLGSSSPPDLLMLDWVMPGISGVEVCRYVRTTRGPVSQLPIILLTAQHGAREITEAFNSGANDYIVKPFVDEEILARVRSLITTRRLQERAEQAELDVRSLLQDAPDAIIGVDAQGLIFFANEEAIHAIGSYKEAIVGKSLEQLVPGISLRQISTGAGESLLPLPDVKIRQRLFSPSVRILPSDRASTTTIALRDVTQRRHAETRRLDFYSIIAHDLRTPLNSIMLRIQLALRGKHGLMPSGLITDLRHVDKNLRSLVGMINDFLVLAKLEGVGYKIAHAPVNANELIESTLSDFKPLLEKARLNCKTVGLDKSVTVLGDEKRLTQVLSNLIGNAIKFTPENGMITISAATTNEHVEIGVEDTGRGIPKDEQPYVFERFMQSREATDSVGSGLGLMIVKEIIEAHAGVIGVDSEVGVGSRFWFRLPREQFVSTHTL